MAEAQNDAYSKTFIRNLSDINTELSNISNQSDINTEILN